MKTKSIFMSFILAAISLPLQAGSLTIPKTFTAGSPAVAADVNQNFTAVENAVDGNAADILILKTHKAGTASISNTNETLVLITDTIYTTLTISVPSSGVIVLNTSGYFVFTSDNSTFRCAITTGSVLDFDYLIIGSGNLNTRYMSFAGTRSYNVAAGSQTFNLVCNHYLGAGYIGRPKLTAIFVPTS